MQMGRFGWITTSCKHAMEFWCTMELSWQLRSENVKAVAKKNSQKIKWAATMKRNCERGNYCFIPWMNLEFCFTYNIFGPRFMRRNLMNVTVWGLFLSPFMRRKLTRRGLRNGEMSRTSWPHRDERWVRDDCRWGCGFLPTVENGCRWEEERCRLPRVKSNGLLC